MIFSLVGGAGGEGGRLQQNYVQKNIHFNYIFSCPLAIIPMKRKMKKKSKNVFILILLWILFFLFHSLTNGKISAKLHNFFLFLLYSCAVV